MIDSIQPLPDSPLTPLDAAPAIRAHLQSTAQPVPSTSFGELLDRLIVSVDARQDKAQELTRHVLLGEGEQLHQSIIARQEASVAFTLMVEMRNKLLESYQELMGMPA